MSAPAKRKAAEASSGSTKKAKAITSFFTSTGVVSSRTSSGKLASIEDFDKDTWVKRLTAEQKKLLKLEIDTLDVSWLAALKEELVTPEFLSLKTFLEGEKEAGKKIYPPENDIYSWSRYTPLNKVKVVILGQDPYHGPNQAHGLCFSVRPPTPAPPSLKNMYTALAKDYPDFTPPPRNGGLLTPWAERGVLMLNACLTVRAADANSHSGKGWEKLTQKAINVVNEHRTKGVVFMAWGTPAGKRVTGIDQKRHLVLTSVHPSPLSAHRGFLTCGHFKKANEWLESRYGADGIIDWSLSTSGTAKTTTEAASEASKASFAAFRAETKAKKSPRKPKNSSNFDVDSDEEQAMIEATMALEKEQVKNKEEHEKKDFEMTGTNAVDRQEKKSKKKEIEAVEDDADHVEGDDENKGSEGNKATEGVEETANEAVA